MALFNFGKKECYLSEDAIKRVQTYKNNQDLYRGNHRKVFNNMAPGQSQTYIAVNLPKLICNVSADLLFGEPPRYTVDDPQVQEAIDRIVASNKLHTQCHESALINAIKGDAIFKVRYGKRTRYSKDREVIIEVVKPDIYHPHIDDETNEVVYIDLVWLVKVEKQHFLRVERHYPGRIENYLYVSDDNYMIGRQMNIQEMYPDVEPVIETGIDDFLVVHIPNVKVGTSHFGISDFDGLEGLFDELNNRLSQISEILDKHARPKLAVPEGIITQQGFLRQEELELIEVANGATLPQYITWDANLEAAYKEVDRIVDLILTVSEVSPSLLGMDNGGQAESGRALKFRLMNTLRKINRKRTYYTAGLKKLLLIAQKMEVAHAGYNYPVMDVDIQWNDGLPNDTQETVDTVIKMYEKGLITQTKALQIIFPELSEEAIKSMVSPDDKGTLDEE